MWAHILHTHPHTWPGRNQFLFSQVVRVEVILQIGVFMEPLLTHSVTQRLMTMVRCQEMASPKASKTMAGWMDG